MIKAQQTWRREGGLSPEGDSFLQGAPGAGQVGSEAREKGEGRARGQAYPLPKEQGLWNFRWEVPGSDLLSLLLWPPCGVCKQVAGIGQELRPGPGPPPGCPEARGWGRSGEGRSLPSLPWPPLYNVGALGLFLSHFQLCFTP